MLIDYHLHTARCGHASGTMQQYIDAARQVGLTEVGIADHIPMYWLPSEKRDPEVAMTDKELTGYIVEVQQLQQANLDITIKLGLEVDYIPGHEKAAEEIISSLPLDYVLGSVHYLDGWGFDNPEYMHKFDQWNLYELYQHYFDTVCQGAKSGLFNIMAHTDLIKKFGHRPNWDLSPLYEQVASTFAESAVSVELNTAGLRYPALEQYPSKELLKVLYKHKVPVTMGSDAHNPQQVGQDIKIARQMLIEVGYKEIATFSNRQIKYCSL
ncbi:MAG: histidinol-phosphatase HisJ family protein [Firmicutes bacterium]|nr:histidinol-phosphatase HisJ family protein [Bacillota bacterium]